MVGRMAVYLAVWKAAWKVLQMVARMAVVRVVMMADQRGSCLVVKRVVETVSQWVGVKGARRAGRWDSRAAEKMAVLWADWRANPRAVMLERHSAAATEIPKVA